MSLPNQLYPTLSNANHGTPQFMYVFDNSYIITGHGQPISGAWRPVSPGDLSSTLTLTGSGINVIVDDVNVSGGQIAISNTPGVIIQNAVVPVSGFSTLTNTSINVAVTGSPTVTITGISSVGINGNVSTVSAGGYVGITGVVSVTNNEYSTVSNSTVSGSNSSITTGQALPSNAARNNLYIQVVGTGSPLYVAYGNTAASQTNFNVLLKADSAPYAGNGGVLTDDAYLGSVMVSGSAGCLFTIWQG